MYMWYKDNGCLLILSYVSLTDYNNYTASLHALQSARQIIGAVCMPLSIQLLSNSSVLCALLLCSWPELIPALLCWILLIWSQYWATPCCAAMSVYHSVSGEQGSPHQQWRWREEVSVSLALLSIDRGDHDQHEHTNNRQAYGCLLHHDC